MILGDKRPGIGLARRLSVGDGDVFEAGKGLLYMSSVQDSISILFFFNNF